MSLKTLETKTTALQPTSMLDLTAETHRCEVLDMAADSRSAVTIHWWRKVKSSAPMGRWL
eukprot:scaffold2495_cov101-Isochrysis_galbana.AAC.14